MTQNVQKPDGIMKQNPIHFCTQEIHLKQSNSERLTMKGRAKYSRKILNPFPQKARAIILNIRQGRNQVKNIKQAIYNIKRYNLQ